MTITQRFTTAVALVAITTTGAHAGKPGRPTPRLTDAPASIVVALDAVRHDLATVRHATPAAPEAEAQLVADLERLADAHSDLAGVPPEVLLAVLRAEILLLSNDLAAILSARRVTEDDDVALAASAWVDSTREAILRAEPTWPVAASADEEVTCFQVLARCFERCANRADVMSRIMCGLDCELQFLGCADDVFEGGPQDIGSAGHLNTP